MRKKYLPEHFTADDCNLVPVQRIKQLHPLRNTIEVH